MYEEKTFIRPLFVLYNLYKDVNFLTNLKHNVIVKVTKNNFSSSKTLYKPRVQLYAGNITWMLASH